MSEPVDIRPQLDEARGLIKEAEAMAAAFAQEGKPGTPDEVLEQADPITDKLEAAQHILLETEVADLPEFEAEEAEESEEGEATHEAPAEPEPEPEPEPDERFDVMLEKQDLENWSRQVEAQVYRSAADLVGEPIVQPGTADEQQDELLNRAAVSLEAALSSKPDPATLVKLVEIRVLQLEIKRAREVCEILLRIDEEGPHGATAREWLEKFDSDPKLKDRGRCFIATAACGSLVAPDVVALRTFRDEVLATRAWGRTLVGLYYRLSPPVAAFIAPRPALRRAVRRLVVAPLAGVVRSEQGPERKHD